MLKLLTREEEQALSRKIRDKKGGNGKSLQARNELVERNFGLAGLMIRKTQFLNLDSEEALSIAYQALVKAASLFNPDKGYRLSTYICSAIRKELIKAAFPRTRKLPLNTNQDLLSSIIDYRENNHEIDEDTARMLYEAIKTLSNREQRILYLRYFTEPHYTLEQVGNELRISKERVSQIQKEAEGKIGDSLRRKGLEAEVVLS